MSNKTKHRVILFGTVFGVLFGVTLLAALLFYNSYYVDVMLSGKQNLVIEYGESYEEQGAQAVLRNRFTKTEIPIEVDTEGEVDNEHVGTYHISYSANRYSHSARKTRTVVVKDTIAPVLELKTEEGSYTILGNAYEEEGYTAIDNYDGDITGRVESYEENGVVYYTVSDSSGNVATAERVIHYKDLNPPEITLAGEDTITISAGQSYIDPGFSAVDDTDGDVTDQVTVTGKVDHYRAGTYSIEYSASDQFGNTAVVTRTVIVEPIRQADTIDPGSKVIYLTFDDGPGPYTQQLLDVLAAYNVKATFFTTAANPKYFSLLSAEAAAGHTVAIHSATHQYSQIYASEEAYFADLKQQSDLIEEQTGIKPMLLRFPGGSSNKVSKKYCPGIMSVLTQAVQDQGYQYFDWNVASGDAGQTKDTEQVFNNVISGVQNHDVSIVLQHDIHKYSVDAVEKIIVWGLSNGYTFLPLDETSPTAHHRVAN